MIKNTSELVEAPQAFIDAIARHNGRETPRKQAKKYSPRIFPKDQKQNIVHLRALLKHIDPDVGYDDWLGVGMAIHHETGGSDEGFDTFNDWSAKGEKYPGEDIISTKWKSFENHTGKPITIATINKLVTDSGGDWLAICDAAEPQFEICKCEIIEPSEARLSHSASNDQQVVVSSAGKHSLSEEPKALCVVDKGFPYTAQPLDPDGFPDKRDSPKGVTLQGTIPNVNHMLSEYGIAVRYNVIKKKLQINIPGLSGSPDNADNSAITQIISLASRNNLPIGQIPSYVEAIGDRNQYNPVADWINSKTWDGIDRLPVLYGTLVERDGYPKSLKNKLMYRWLLSAIAAALKARGFRSRGVLTIQGPQSVGKTAWVSALVTDPTLRADVVKLDHHLDAGNKDSQLLAIGHWIVEIGELDSSFKKDIARLKGFITSDRDKVRRPYARTESEYPRRTVFCATVNSQNFLVDDTGNTRFWTIPVTSIDYVHGIDMQQVFAQLAVDFQNGEQWWLTPDEETLLEEHNKSHRNVSVIRERVLAAIDPDGPKEKLKAFTASELLREIGIDNPTNQQAKECGGVLREYVGEPKKIRGQYKWRVQLREP